jgi:CheY-like chemotaxis protein
MHMVIHELTTNACKYGALRSSPGRVDIRWSFCDDQRYELIWHERCAEPVVATPDLGYGSRLIEQLVSYDLNGTFSREYRASGVRCRIEFSLEDLEGSTPLHVPLQGPSSVSTTRVLVVEDNATLAMGLCDDLDDEGFGIVGPARSLEQALALSRSKPIDVAVLDVDLAGTPSYPLARELRKRGIPFALLTGYNRSDLPDEFHDVEILTKPISPDDLYAFIRKSVDHAC